MKIPVDFHTKTRYNEGNGSLSVLLQDPLDAQSRIGVSPHHSELSVATRQLAVFYGRSLEQHRFKVDI